MMIGPDYLTKSRLQFIKRLGTNSGLDTFPGMVS